MDKRLHKTSFNLTYRHYLFHFKWPLIAFIFSCVFISLIQTNLSTILTPLSERLNDNIPAWSLNVIYPTDIFNGKSVNSNVTVYFMKKDRLKAIDDAFAVKKHEKTILPLESNQTFSSKTFLILEYTNVFGKPRFCTHTREEIFGKTCPYKNCDYTCDLNLDKEADVLLMHKRDLNKEHLDQIQRDPDQIWLLWHDESNEKSPEINRFKFNWTMTYRMSAEASLSAYGITIAKQKPWSTNKFSAWINEQYEKRFNQAVWFVSNCAPKKRLKHFRSLRKHYPIVAFGQCISSNESYSRNAHIHSDVKCNRQSSCEKLYLSTSKFYLAFESQTCTDYITEKFWRTLAVGAIPIISGPERGNFERIAPPNSFLHIDDYETEVDLAKVLDQISTNRTLFQEYHQWRRFYDVLYEAKDVDPYRFCELCYRLNTNKHRIWYENINEWFLDKC